MKKTMTVTTCDLCGHVSYDDTVETRKWALVSRTLYPNPISCPSYLDLCPSCYEALVRFISSRRPKRTNKDQMTFDKDFPDFVTEEKSGNYFEILANEWWKND